MRARARVCVCVCVCARACLSLSKFRGKAAFKISISSSMLIFLWSFQDELWTCFLLMRSCRGIPYDFDLSLYLLFIGRPPSLAYSPADVILLIKGLQGLINQFYIKNLKEIIYCAICHFRKKNYLFNTFGCSNIKFILVCHYIPGE